MILEIHWQWHEQYLKLNRDSHLMEKLKGEKVTFLLKKSFEFLDFLILESSKFQLSLANRKIFRYFGFPTKTRNLSENFTLFYIFSINFPTVRIIQVREKRALFPKYIFSTFCTQKHWVSHQVLNLNSANDFKSAKERSPNKKQLIIFRCQFHFLTDLNFKIRWEISR